MKALFPLLAAVLALSACTSTAGGGVEPIPGSITYGGQPATRLQKAPVGSTFSHQLLDEYGRRSIEVYRIQPDRSLKLLSRNQTEDD